MRSLVAIVIVVVAISWARAEQGVVRLCVGAGKRFPETEEGLRTTVTRLLDEAKAPEPTEPLFACVVPHGRDYRM